jgi:cytochrome c peroxidase
MGFSVQNGRPGINDLITKLRGINYYQELFTSVYGDVNITETRLQQCLAGFVRSIQSFDSKYDVGRAQAPNDGGPFANFTAQENQGKMLWITPPQFDATGNRIGGGLGCNACHNAPEFDIDPNTRNNGIIGTVNSNVLDLDNTRAPSLRELLRTNGELNGPMMHTGVIKNIQAAIGHYGAINIAPGNNNLDPRLRPNGFGQRLNLTAPEVNAVMAFLGTLSGTNVYADTNWANPFK